MAETNVSINSEADNELVSLGYPRRNTGAPSPRHNKGSFPVSRSVTFEPPVPRQNIFVKFYNYIKPTVTQVCNMPSNPPRSEDDKLFVYLFVYLFVVVV